MAAFVIFDQSSGAVQGTYTITDPSQLSLLMTLNQKSGCGTMQVSLEQVNQIHNPSQSSGQQSAGTGTLQSAGWSVKNGTLQGPSVTPIAPATPVAAK